MASIGWYGIIKSIEWWITPTPQQGIGKADLCIRGAGSGYSTPSSSCTRQKGACPVQFVWCVVLKGFLQWHPGTWHSGTGSRFALSWRQCFFFPCKPFRPLVVPSWGQRSWKSEEVVPWALVLGSCELSWSESIQNRCANSEAGP